MCRRRKLMGKMHACGLMGIHRDYLENFVNSINDLKDEIEGNVKFAFQPGEEKSGGAR